MPVRRVGGPRLRRRDPPGQAFSNPVTSGLTALVACLLVALPSEGAQAA